MWSRLHGALLHQRWWHVALAGIFAMTVGDSVEQARPSVLAAALGSTIGFAGLLLFAHGTVVRLWLVIQGPAAIRSLTRNRALSRDPVPPHRLSDLPAPKASDRRLPSGSAPGPVGTPAPSPSPPTVTHRR